MTKKERQELILKLIEENDISTQKDLIRKLSAAGCYATQATVSRDVRELNMVKRRGDDSNRYTISEQTGEATGVWRKYRNILSDSIISAECSSVFCVLKTYSGMANAAAAAIDSIGFPEMLGSIAGDDTIFIIFRNENDAAAFCERMRSLDI